MARYVECEEHVQCLDTILSMLFFNNRTIQLLTLNLSTESIPYEVQLKTLLKTTDCMKQLYQQESLTPVQSYALRMMSSILSVTMKSSAFIFSDPQLLASVFDIIELSEEKTIQTVDDAAATKSTISDVMSSIITFIDCFSFTPELASSLISHFFSASSWVKKSFYLSLITEVAIKMAEIPQEKEIIRFILLSMNSVLYKVGIRLMTLFAPTVCEVLEELSPEDQNRVLCFFLRYSLTNVHDAISTKNNKQDAYSSDIKQMLSLVLEITSSVSLLSFPSIQQTVSNLGRYHIWIFRVSISFEYDA